VFKSAVYVMMRIEIFGYCILSFIIYLTLLVYSYVCIIFVLLLLLFNYHCRVASFLLAVYSLYLCVCVRMPIFV